MAKVHSEDAQVDMTPMIDVVFQLIIFFIVTIKMEDRLNEDIILEDSPHGPIIEEMDPKTTVIEIDKNGWISMHGAPVKPQILYNMLKNKFAKYNQFPILIRADYRTQHRHIKQVMDLCTKIGLWRINFAAINEHKQTAGRHMGIKRTRPGKLY